VRTWDRTLSSTSTGEEQSEGEVLRTDKSGLRMTTPNAFAMHEVPKQSRKVKS
jgi:hypothetical protein